MIISHPISGGSGDGRNVPESAGFLGVCRGGAIWLVVEKLNLEIERKKREKKVSIKP